MEKICQNKKRWFCKHFTTFFWFLLLPNQPINQFVSCFARWQGKRVSRCRGCCSLQSYGNWSHHPKRKNYAPRRIWIEIWWKETTGFSWFLEGLQDLIKGFGKGGLTQTLRQLKNLYVLYIYILLECVSFTKCARHRRVFRSASCGCMCVYVYIYICK